MTVAPIPAVRIHQDRGGNWQAHAVILNYSRTLGLEAACVRVAAHQTVFVTEDDAAAVLAAARGDNPMTVANGAAIP